MKQHLALGKKQREAIFQLFIKNNTLKFNEIEKQTNLRSNHLSYHLDHLTKQDIIEKEGDYYKLTKHAEKLIPYVGHITQKEQGPLSIIVAAVLNENKICLLKREKRPYKDYWGMIGGKIQLHESIKQTAIREVKEETNLECTFDKTMAVLHERVKSDEDFKHAFVIFFCAVKTDQHNTISSDEGKLEWFSLDELPKNIIPSDRYMIEALINKDFSCKDIVIEDKDGELIHMGVEEIGKL